jgi:outer membrane protein assembly factor BamB
VAVALVSCGSARSRPTTTSAPPSVPSTTVTVTKPPAHSAALPWPTYGSDNARRRAVAATGLRPPFRKLWTFHGRALLEFPPVVGYGRVFEEALDGRLYSIEPAGGRIRWRYSAHRCGWSSPALADHLLFATFIGNRECHATLTGGELLAFSPETGRIRWRRMIGPSESSPLVEDGTVYVADQNGYVYAFAARSGHLRWRFGTGAPIKASPSFAYGRIYIGNYGGEMLALAARTGRLVWRSVGYGNFYATAAVNAGRVYVGSLDGRVYALSARSGALLWSFGTGSYVYASPALWHGLVLVGSYDHDFYALEGGTGSLRWTYRARAPISSAASVVDGVVYFSSFDHRTYGLLAASGRLRAEWPDGEYSPAVAGNGRLYLVGLGRIYALRPAR